MKINKLFIGFIFLLFSSYSHAQLNFDFIEGKFFIKGRVTDIQSKEPIPQANVRITNTGKGTTCDDEGYFSIVVSKKDTLKFTSTGYISKTILVINIDSNEYHTLQVELLRDFIKLKEVTVYPFGDLEGFKKAFMDAKGEGKVIATGLPEVTYTGIAPKPKLYNPVSYLYEKLRRRRAANPDFKP
jgi:hypothetical protein